MDKDSKSGWGGLSGNGLLAVLLLAAGAFVLHEVPLESTRPAANEPRIDQHFAPQDVDARLWQDPFGAVERARDESARRLKGQDAEREALRRRDSVLRDAIDVKLSAPGSARVDEVVVLAVMLPGGPYAEYVEARRRTRYAVLAALNAGNFTPVSTEHLGYFRPGNNEAMPRDVPETVPFEWFEPAPDGRRPCGSCELLVLWIDNDAFYLNPFARLKRLFDPLRPPDSDARLRWRVIGPVGSDGLRAMVDEAAHPGYRPDVFQGMDVRFLSPSATVPDRLLLEPVGPSGSGNVPGSLADFFAQRGISLLRTSGDDERLATALVDELALRGLRPRGAAQAAGEPEEAWRDRVRALCRRDQPARIDDDAPQHIAVVAEWDTLYGRSLRRQFMIDRGGRGGFCVSRFTYVRGLDGRLPDSGPATSPAAAAKPAGATAADRRKDGSLIERAEGQSQYDYLRRLAAALRERDRALRAGGAPGAGLRAIGVLGNDVHDKLLVLQALQPEFPNALFFTTDLDARLLHPGEQAWARNLIVASNFGLRLADGLQAGTAPFRDAYQSAGFLATRLALSWLQPGSAPRVDSQAAVDRWLKQPRIFEIGRTAAFDFSAPATSASATACRADRLAACTDIHPPGSPRYPVLRTPLLAASLSGLLLLLWLPVLSISRPLRRRLRRLLAPGRAGPGAIGRRLLRVAGLLLLPLAVLHVALPLWLAGQWPRFADWLTEGGKPMSLTEGISIWPTEAVYLVTLLLCLYLVFRGWTALTRNLDEIALALHLGKTRRQLNAELDRQNAGLTGCQRLVKVFDPHAAYALPPGSPARDPAMTSGALSFWTRYIAQNRTASRVARSTAGMALVVGFGLLLRWAVGEAPGIPVRGNVSAQVHVGLAVAAVVAMTFLVFCVTDATWFCVRFVQELRRYGANWPQRTLNHFQARLGPVPPRLLDHWIDLQFAARRTRCVSGLIYYPFIVLSLLLVARNPAFDDWQLPLGLMVMSLVSVAIVLACVVMLRLSVERSRRAALAEVDEALLRANARDATGPATPAQLQMLRRQIDELQEGAFAPFARQPLLKALLLPFATLGSSTVLEYLALLNI